MALPLAAVGPMIPVRFEAKGLPGENWDLAGGSIHGDLLHLPRLAKPARASSIWRVPGSQDWW